MGLRGVPEALGRLPEDPGQTYEGEGGEREDQEDRAVEEEFHDDDSRGKGDGNPVDDLADQRILLARINTASIL